MKFEYHPYIPTGTIFDLQEGESSPPDEVAIAIDGGTYDFDQFEYDQSYHERNSPFSSSLWQDFSWVPQFFFEVGVGPAREVGSEQIVDHIAFKTEWLKAAMGLSPSQVALVTAKGDSMEPVIGDGDLLLTDLREFRTIDPSIYIIRLDNALLAKRIQITEGGNIRIRSDNPFYKPEEVPAGDVNILGRVVWIGRKARPGLELGES